MGQATPQVPSAQACRLVLVPRVNRVREVTELSEEQQAALWREVDAAARVVQVRWLSRERPLGVCLACENSTSLRRVGAGRRCVPPPSRERWVPAPCCPACLRRTCTARSS